MNAVLQAKNLSKIYGRGESEVRALNRCDLTFEEGGFTAIVGRSGSGKTTLLHLLGGLDMPTTGTVLLEGRDIYALSDKQRTILRRRRIGFVFQFYNLVPELTAWQNIVLPLNLDGRSGGEVLELLHLSRRRFGQTLVLVTHDLRIAEGADRVLTLEDGLVAADSTSDSEVSPV